MDASRFGRRNDGVMVGVKAAVPYIVFDRPRKEEGILGDKADLLAQGLDGNRIDVLTVDQDLALRSFIEPGNEAGDTAFPGAGRPGDGHSLAGLDAGNRHRAVLQHRAHRKN